MKGKIIFSGSRIFLTNVYAQLCKTRLKENKELPEWIDNRSFKIELNEQEIEEYKKDLKNRKNRIMLKVFRFMNLRIDLIEENGKNVSTTKIQADAV